MTNLDATENLSSSVYAGMNVQLNPAPLTKRFLAYGVDMGIIIAAIYLIVFIAIIFFGISIALLRDSAPGKIMLPIMFLILILAVLGFMDIYFIYWEKKRGATPGKKLFGLRVVSLEGGPLSLNQAIIRELIRYIDVTLILPGFISVFVNKRHRRLGDLAAGTIVIHSPTAEKGQGFMFIQQQQYMAILDTVKIDPISDSAAKTFLAHAFTRFIVKNPPLTESEISMWDERVKSVVHFTEETPATPESLCRFFAEYLSQEFNQNIRLR